MAKNRVQLRDAAYTAAGGLSGVISPTDALRMVNEAAAELYELLVNTFDRWYTISLTSASTTIASGASSFALPAGWLKLEGVEWWTGSKWQDVERMQFSERNRVSHRSYEVVNDNLLIRPGTDAPGLYQIWYTPAYVDFADDNATLDCINGWEEYVEVDAAIRMRDAEEDDVSVLMARKAALIKRIQSSARNRDAGRSRKPRNVRPSLYQRILAADAEEWGQ